jgi:MFS family permease
LIGLAGVLLLLKSTWFSATAVIPQLAAEWRLSPALSVWLTIAVQLGFVAGAVVSTTLTLSDILAPQRLIFASAAGAATANALLVVAGGPRAGIPLRFLTGLFIAGVYPPALKLAATWYREGRGAALGLLVGALTTSSAIPHLINGLGGLDWHLVVYTTSLLTLLGGAAVLLIQEGPFPFPSATLDLRQIKLALANPGVRLASAGYLCHMWELYAMWSWFLIFFSDALAARGHNPWPAAAYVTFAVIGIGGLGNWVGGALGDRWGRTRIAILMLAVSGTCSATIGLFFHVTPWVLVVIGLVWGFSIVADSPQFSTMTTEVADQAYVGTALTLQMASGFALTGVTIWLVPALQHVVGWRWGFAVLAVGPVLGIFTMLRFRQLPQASLVAGGRG